MTDQPTLTITIPVNSTAIGGALDAAWALVGHLEAAQEMLSRLVALLPEGAPRIAAPATTPASPAQAMAAISGVRQTPARPSAEEPPPRAVAETNGHGPSKHRGPLTSPARRRRYSDEEKAAVAARAHEVGVSKAAEEHEVSYDSVKRWVAAHPKEHAMAEPIRGDGPKVGESREAWEARKRAAAGMAL